jgi:hypothetical protein
MVHRPTFDWKSLHNSRARRSACRDGQAIDPDLKSIVRRCAFNGLEKRSRCGNKRFGLFWEFNVALPGERAKSCDDQSHQRQDNSLLQKHRERKTRHDAKIQRRTKCGKNMSKNRPIFGSGTRYPCFNTVV